MAQRQRCLALLISAFWIYAAHAQVSAPVPVTSVNGQQGAVTVKTVPAPLCQNTTIPVGNVVTNTANETPFTSACYIPAGTVTGPVVISLRTWGLLGVAATIPTLRGRVLLVKPTSSVITCTGNASTAACSVVGTPATINCIAVNGCVQLLDTGAQGGLTAGQNLFWTSDVSLGFLSATTVEASGLLSFQTGATAVIGVAADSATSTSSSPVTVDMTTDEYVVYAADWNLASTQNFIQVRQMTGK